MSTRRLGSAAAWCLALLATLTLWGCGTARAPSAAASGTSHASGSEAMPAFPGAPGWAAHTPGGRGGRIIRVSTLAGSGPGSFREAVEAAGPRIIVFEVGGIIDLERQNLAVREPFVTIAGQTAPSPGITLIRGGIAIRTHDVVIQHLRIRPGEAGAAKLSGWEVDGIASTAGAYNVIVDHCSLSWATDENLSASGPRFEGADPEEWRRNTSHRITFSNNIIAEGLSNSTHAKGEHSKGTLIHDNASEILLVGNLYAHNMERNPLFKGGARGAIVNNLIYNPGRRAIHYNLLAEEWEKHPYQTGQMVLVGNVVRAGPSTSPDLALLMVGGAGDLEFYAEDNLSVDRSGNALPDLGHYRAGTGQARQVEVRPLWPAGLNPLPSAAVQDSVLRNAGARPWDRDAVDRRIVAEAIAGEGRIIDSEQEVGGYPTSRETREAFDPEEWDLRFMIRR